jgi:hypothetical protein
LPFASTSAKAHLIQSSNCEIYLHGGPTIIDIVEVLSANSTIKFMQIPELSELLWQLAASEFPYKMAWNQAKDHPWLIFHSSGTTGRINAHCKGLANKLNVCPSWSHITIL